ncbi:MAG: YchJ family protein [Gammaproteobacteria bacterium]|nr:YchJ family protein [Gammaproteobacteria bacterium]
MSQCPCQSGKDYAECCGPIIEGERPAATAEALMRSRYSAFAKAAPEYLETSLHPDHRSDYDASATKKWSEDSQWSGLEIIATEAGGENDDTGMVEFIASYRYNGGHHRHHEKASFEKVDGIWYYTDGDIVPPGTVRNANPKVGRNDPCPCGSGKKYKKCCMAG